jgi:HSP20 family molecular chaperone IbpA
MTQEEKKIFVPWMNTEHNDDDTGLLIWIDLAGASKESVDLNIGEKGFCIKAEAENFRYENCYMLEHKVNREEAKAKFNSGFLTINVPFKEAWHGHKVNIQ